MITKTTLELILENIQLKQEVKELKALLAFADARINFKESERERDRHRDHTRAIGIKR